MTCFIDFETKNDSKQNNFLYPPGARYVVHSTRATFHDSVILIKPSNTSSSIKLPCYVFLHYSVKCKCTS
jgi:hypothetical protein